MALGVLMLMMFGEESDYRRFLVFFAGFFCWKELRSCRFVPSTFSETKPQMVPRDDSGPNLQP